MPKTETLRWSAITLFKDTFRPSNKDILKPKGIRFPTMYNTKYSPFDTKLTQFHRLLIRASLWETKNSKILRKWSPKRTAFFKSPITFDNDLLITGDTCSSKSDAFYPFFKKIRPRI